MAKRARIPDEIYDFYQHQREKYARMAKLQIRDVMISKVRARAQGDG